VSPETTTPVLLVEGLRKIYPAPTPQAEAVEAIRDLTFSIVGPSGAGKTTLLKCIAGLLPATAGRLELEGKAITGPPKTMAVVFQEYGRSLYPWMSVQANVELPLKAAGISKAERRERSNEALEAVGLSDAADKYPWQLSGGMQQRVAIARAVAYRPQILLMDEPFAAVDAQTRADLEDLVRKIWKELGVTVLFVTHDIDESVYLGQRVIVLSNRPTIVQDDVTIDLPDERDQLSTRSDPRFVELRHHIYGEIQRAKGNRGGQEQAASA
jgi:NitT/TauT family transport system ATP-binding protein